MKTILTAILIILSANASAWEPLPSISGINQPSNLTTFGSNNFQTTTGSLQGRNVQLNTFGTDSFQTTTGTVGGRSVHCNTYGPSYSKTTTCD